VGDAFRVDPERLAEAVQQMADFQRYSEALLQEIDSTVKNLHLTWTGQAASAHAQAHGRWSRGEAMMQEALTQLQAAGRTAHTNYTGAMAKNLDMWS
jgi:WXG100 family type VII secretion target